MGERDKRFDLGDYIEVKDRIRIFYELYGNGRLVTDSIELTRSPDDRPRVIVKALAYRTPDDPLPGVGYSWLELPGKTPYTAGSEVENAETSAWGRAIASLGILIDRSIASAQEVENKKGEPEPLRPKNSETERLLGETTRTGRIARGQGMLSDLQWRDSPQGHIIRFRLDLPGKDDKGNPKSLSQVWVPGELGETLFAAGIDPDKLLGKRAACTGPVYEVTQPGRTTYYRMKVTRLEIDGLPAVDIRVPVTMPPEADPDEAELDAIAETLPWPDSLPLAPA